MKRANLLLIALFACTYAIAQSVLLAGVTSTGAGSAVEATYAGSKQFQAYAQTTAGTGTAVITVECSLNGTVWNSTPLGTISLSVGTTTVAEGLTTTDRCRYLRGNVSSISGTGTSATLLMGQ